MTAIVSQDKGQEKKPIIQDGGADVKTGEEPVPIPQPPATLSTASLYVGDLSPTVDENKLKAKFSEVGHVLSVRVCRDALTRQSLHYGYVNFVHSKDAQKAMTDLNFEPLDGHPMRIMWSERDPELRRRGKGNLFIKNLGDHVDSKAIYDTFTMFGAILSCKVVLDENFKSKGYGFIHFENEESATQAIEKVNGMELDGKNIYVGNFMSRAKRQNLSEENYTNVFVKNFDEKVDVEKLKELFSQYGVIKSGFVRQSPNGPPGKAYGFVDFEKHDEAVKAVSEMNGKEWEGSELYVSRAMNKAERMAHLQSQHRKREKEAEQRNRSNLYVRFYDAITSDENLKQLFETYGPINSAKVMRDEHGCSRQFGFVAFHSVSDANRALLGMDTKLINGKPIHVAMAQSKSKRHEMMQHMKDVYQSQSQLQRAAPFYPRPSSHLPQSMAPIQQVRLTPHNAYPQQYRSMSVSYPPSGMPSQPMMRYPQQQIGYTMGFPSMQPHQMPYGHVNRPLQPQTYSNIIRSTNQGSTFTTIPPVVHSQMDVKGKEIGMGESKVVVGSMGNKPEPSDAVQEKDTIQTGSMRDALIQPVSEVLKKDERIGADVMGIIGLITKNNPPSKIMTAMQDEKKLAEMIRGVTGNPKGRL